MDTSNARPSDEVLCRLYLQNGWEDPQNEPFPDPAIADDVWAMISAPTLDAAVRVVEYWGPSRTRRAEVRSLRAMAWIVEDPTTLIERLRAEDSPEGHEAAEEILRLRQGLESLEEIVGGIPAHPELRMQVRALLTGTPIEGPRL